MFPYSSNTPYPAYSCTYAFQEGLRADIISGAGTTAATGGIGGGEPPTPGIPLGDVVRMSKDTFSGDGLLLVSIEALS